MDYRFSFQSQESDDEIRGDGNSLNYKFRMHDPRIGRFFAVDPLAAKYPYWTPYQFSGLMPIKYIELEGLEPYPSKKNYNKNIYLANYRYTTVLNLRSEIDAKYNSLSNTHLNNKNWNSYHVPNLSNASKIIEEIALNNGKVDNIYMQFHGTSGAIAILPDFSGQDISSSDFNAYGRHLITSDDLNLYIDVNSIKRKRKRDKAYANLTVVEKKKYDVVANLDDMMENITDGGNLIIGSCQSGDGKRGDQLLQSLYSLSENRINIFLSTSSVIGIKDDQVLDKDRTVNSKWKTMDNSSIVEVESLQLNSSGDPVKYNK